MVKKQLTSTWNYAEGWIMSQWQDFIKPAYQMLETKEYEKARMVILNICNSTTYYQKKTKIYEEIIELKTTMNKLKSAEYFQAKNDGDSDKTAKIKNDSVQAMYNILEKINYMFAKLGCFIGVYMKDEVMGSTKMN